MTVGSLPRSRTSPKRVAPAGNCLSRTSASPAPPANAASRSGQRPACGNVCSRRCWTIWAPERLSVGRGPSWTPSPCRHATGVTDRSTPVDRGSPGGKINLLTDRRGLPLTVGIQRPTPTTPVCSFHGCTACPRYAHPTARVCRPAMLDADEVYYNQFILPYLRRRHITAASPDPQSSASMAWPPPLIIERSLSQLMRYRTAATTAS